ncbi:MAG TPA: glycoside hydrolase family 3 protein [Synergistaceae bacterium]|nr:glycoside hydrolase family 3 protein [Synergistaceae bacterium]
MNRKKRRALSYGTALLGLFLIFGVVLGGTGAPVWGEIREEHRLCSLQVYLRGEHELEKLSLEEKIGQILFLSFSGGAQSEELEELLRRYAPGGFILYSSRGNVDSPEQVVALISRAQKEARRYGVLSPFFAIDQEGGLVDRLRRGVTVFPGNMALGAAGKAEFAREQARITASELRALGITWNFAPVVDVNSNPANPVINIRSFGEDPELVSALGTSMVVPYAEAGVLCSAKHYPGHGDTHVDSHVGLPKVERTLEELEKVDLLPFRKMALAGVPSIMTAHVLVPALAPEHPELPATLSREVLSKLREENFRGLIVTDSMGMGALRERWGAGEAALLAVEAGADVLLYGADPGSGIPVFQEVYSALLGGVRTGRIPEERLDESVLRILTAKIQAGLLDDPFPRPDWKKILQKETSLGMAREIAEKSITLLHNRGNLLPLSEKERIPLLLPEERREKAQPLLEKVPQLVPLSVPATKGCGELLLPEEIDFVRKAPFLAVASWGIGKNPELFEELQRLGALFPEKKMLYLALRSPYDLLKVPEAEACLCTYGDVPSSLEALGAVLRGEKLPQGALPVELPGLYPRGWGMRHF